MNAREKANRSGPQQSENRSSTENYNEDLKAAAAQVQMPLKPTAYLRRGRGQYDKPTYRANLSIRTSADPTGCVCEVQRVWRQVDSMAKHHNA